MAWREFSNLKRCDDCFVFKKRSAAFPSAEIQFNTTVWKFPMLGAVEFRISVKRCHDMVQNSMISYSITVTTIGSIIMFLQVIESFHSDMCEK